ncbi:MAG TPA: type II secretion system protein GspK [Fimbriimonadaceae bacterium]|nr:type II secretion system protein GspK [Fimbriimonadaceae bacterium]
MNRRGAVMLVTLVVLTSVAAILAVGFARYRVEVRAGLSELETYRARLMARSALARAMSVLQTVNTNTVSQVDEWFSFGNTGSEAFLVGADRFAVQVVDAASLVNLNTATEQELLALNLTQEQIDSLLDWREEGVAPRPEGAKDEFYNTLSVPYNAKLGRLSSLDEVLLIKGFLPSSLYEVPEQSSTTGIEAQPLAALATVDSFSPNNSSAGEIKGNINAVQQQQLVQAGLSQQLSAAIIVRRNQGTFTSLGEVLRVTGMDTRSAGIIVDNFMIGGAPRSEGKINVNTATEAVLATVPGITPDTAQSIFGRQSTGLASLSELLQVPGYSLQVMQESIDRFTVSSDTFLIRAEGTAGSTTYSLEAVVSLTGGIPHILKTNEQPNRSMRGLWQWSDETTTETVITEAP